MLRIKIKQINSCLFFNLFQYLLEAIDHVSIIVTVEFFILISVHCFILGNGVKYFTLHTKIVAV